MPAEVARAELLDTICQRWPGYTLSTALAENGRLIMRTLALVAIHADAVKPKR